MSLFKKGGGNKMPFIFKVTSIYEMNRYPKHCRECPCYREKPYTCHNERGYEGHCALGYMRGYDMRDFNSGKKFEGCKMDTNPNVIIKDISESRNKNEVP